MLRRGLFGLAMLPLLPGAVLAQASAPGARLSEIQSRGVVRIGVPVDVPPFGSVNAQRQPEGFDVELAGIVAKQLGVRLELQQITSVNRIPFLLTDRLDIVISVMGATPERAKQIMFTSPYANLYLGVFGPKDSPVTSAATVGRARIGATRGTTQDLALTEMLPRGSQIVRFEDDATTAAAYLAGQVDLFSSVNLIALDLAKKNPTKAFDQRFVIRTSPAHMGVRMGEHDLRQWLDTTIFFLKMNGELDRLHRTWLGEPMAALPSL